MDVPREIERLWDEVANILSRLRDLESEDRSDPSPVGFSIDGDEDDFDEEDPEYRHKCRDVGGFRVPLEPREP